MCDALFTQLAYLINLFLILKYLNKTQLKCYGQFCIRAAVNGWCWSFYNLLVIWLCTWYLKENSSQRKMLLILVSINNIFKNFAKKILT